MASGWMRGRWPVRPSCWRASPGRPGTPAPSADVLSEPLRSTAGSRAPWPRRARGGEGGRVNRIHPLELIQVIHPHVGRRDVIELETVGFDARLELGEQFPGLVLDGALAGGGAHLAVERPRGLAAAVAQHLAGFLRSDHEQLRLRAARQGGHADLGLRSLAGGVRVFEDHRTVAEARPAQGIAQLALRRQQGWRGDRVEIQPVAGPYAFLRHALLREVLHGHGRDLDGRSKRHPDSAYDDSRRRLFEEELAVDFVDLRQRAEGGEEKKKRK